MYSNSKQDIGAHYDYQSVRLVSSITGDIQNTTVLYRS